MTQSRNKRKTTEEFIAQASNIHHNKYNYSKTYYINNHSKVTIICNKHGEFLQSPSVHLNGSGCKKCSYESKSITWSDFIKNSNNIHGQYSYEPIKNITYNTRINIICKDHGKFIQTVGSHLQKHGCPKCGGTSKSNTKSFIKKANAKHNNSYLYNKVTYTNNATKVIITCKKHGDFSQTPNAHLSGNGCKQCDYDKKRNTIVDFIKLSNETHNYKYNYSESNYINNYTKVKIKCKNHGEFLQKPIAHISGHGCFECERIKKTKPLKIFISQAKEIHNNKYIYTKSIYINNRTKIEIHCKLHGSFLQRPKDHLNGDGCPKCTNRISTQESQWLDSLNILECNRQISLPGLSQYMKVDGYDPITHTIYEFYGDYWHGNLKVYNAEDINPSNKKTYGELYRKTMEKELCIKEAGYNLISIWEHDFNQIKSKLLELKKD